MCLDPVSAGLALGSAALGAGGSYLNGQEQAKNTAAQINARNSATEAELARQKAYEATSQGAFNKTLGTFAPNAQATALANNQANARDAFAANAPGNVGTIGTGFAPQGVGADANSMIARILSGGAARDAAQGNLTGYGDTMRNNAFALGSGGQALDTVSNFARQSANVGTKEAEAAYNNAARTPSGLGDLLSFGGTLLGSAAGRGWNPFASATPAVSPRLVGANGMVAGPV